MRADGNIVAASFFFFFFFGGENISDGAPFSRKTLGKSTSIPKAIADRSRLLDTRASLAQVQPPREIRMVALLKITRTYTRETCPPTYPKVRLASGCVERTG